MRDKNWMIYGAYGYTGHLIAANAAARGLRPVLAGRSTGRLVETAAKLGLEHRAFDLAATQTIGRHLRGCALLLNCAGPFSATAAPMLGACLNAGVHYLDVTGEIAVFEHAHSLYSETRQAGIVVCPGVGFDVIPTDCVAATLSNILPDATHLALGFDSDMHLSPGTAKTSFEGLAQGGKIRRDGRIVDVPLAWQTREIDFGRGRRNAVTIPWGDVSTAWYSTGIANIETYIACPPKLTRRLRQANRLRPLLALRPVQRFVKRRIEKRTTGPGESRRQAAPSYVWGEVRNGAGEIRTARIRTANGYDLTVDGALAIVAHLLANDVPAGATTPSRLMGPDFVTTLPGSGDFEIL